VGAGSSLLRFEEVESFVDGGLRVFEFLAQLGDHVLGVLLGRFRLLVFRRHLRGAGDWRDAMR
jgi:hypothetical protein